MVTTPEPSAPPAYSLWQILRYFLRLGALGFGGPVALVGYMHRDLVESRRWISEADYKEGLTLAQIMPGPMAAQLAIYLGYIHYRILGASLVGLAFVLPSFLMVVALGWAYSLYGGLHWMQAVFYGVAAAVIGIIAHSAYKLTKKTIARDYLLWIIYLASASLTAITQRESILLVLAAGILVWLIRTPPVRLWTKSKVASLSFPFLAVAPFAFDPPLLAQIFAYFAMAGTFVFGSGLAIVPFLHGGVVLDHKWLNDQQFLDAVAVAMITPGPVVITVGFIGYLAAGFWGATLAALGTFLPCYLLTILPAPYFKKYGKRPALVAFIDGVTAAAIGAIAGAVIVLGRRSLTDIPTVLLALAALAVLWKVKKAPEPFIVLAAAIIGLFIYPLTHP